MTTLIFATNNEHKIKEIQSLVRSDFKIITLKEAGIEIDIPEHQCGAEIRPLRLHPGKRPRGDGRQRRRPAQQRGREGVLPGPGRRRPQELP